MKIKKVEIQAFRAYNRVEDCTFDFLTKEGKSADFVAIYAPNGFGKTSFYDAVEWGITNNIYRFVRHSINKDYAKDEKLLKYEIDKAKSPQYILRHKNSPDDLESFVKILFDKPDEEVFRAIPKAPRIDSRDYDFDDVKSENTYFRKVILSQDSIDSFLKEDKPEARYKKFIEFFGDKDLDAAYSNIISLLRVNDSKIEGLHRQISDLRKENLSNNDDEILDKINSRINFINSLGEDIPVITVDFSDNELLNFSNLLIDKRLATANVADQYLSKIDYLKARDSETEVYNKSILTFNMYNINVDNLTKVKDTFKKINELNNHIANKSRVLDSLAIELIEIGDIKRMLPSFYSARRQIYVNKVEIEGNSINLNSKIAAVRILNTNNIELKAKHEVALNELFKIENSLKDSIQLEEDINDNQDEINKSNAELIRNNKLVIEIDKKINDYFIVSRSLEFEINQLKNKDISNSLKTEDGFKSIYEKISNNKIEVEKLKTLIKESAEKIAEHQRIGDEYSKLIANALNIVKTTLVSKCPCCGEQYHSYADLVSKIESSSFGDKFIIAENAKIDESQTLIAKLEKDTDNEIKDILLKKQNLLQANMDNISANQQTRKEILLNESNVKKVLLYFEALQKENFVVLDGLTILQYREKLINLLPVVQEKVADWKKQLDQNVEASSQLSTEISILSKIQSTLEADLRLLEISKEYLSVNKFLIKNDLLSIDDENSLDALEGNKQKEINNIVNEINLLKKQVSNLTPTVQTYNEVLVDSEILFMTDLINKVTVTISAFENFVLSEYGKDHLELPIAEIEKVIKGSIVQYSLLYDNAKQILLEYKKIEEYKESVMPYLKSKIIQYKIDELTIKIEFQESIGKLLNDEKDDLSSFINLQIESFFYEDMINRIYRKIDPHPDYKRIVFRCDFSAEEPKLNVFVNGDGREHLIPNLYFSTAQMNILSMSIFLAKAINAKDDFDKEVNCIFIDDPIQAMDSINILSTIDLLRSISFNLSKQIILSTHDENFYKLLQRKMPSDTFNSKFIELETFGKVKRN